MGSKVKLGSYLTLLNNHNTANELGARAVRGISVNKEFVDTKADLSHISLTSYKLVLPNTFAYVPDTSRRGNKICLAYNRTATTFLVSSIYTTFTVKESEGLIADYLFLLFNRSEFDRYSRFNSWGSAREVFSWEDLCDTEVELPSIEIQRKYAAIYESMFTNQQTYERGLNNLKLSCDMLYDECKRAKDTARLGELLSEVDMRNSNERCSDARGISLEHAFIPSRAALKSNTRYKLVEPGNIACNLIHVGRDRAYPIAKNDESDCVMVSPDYFVFSPCSAIIGSYLMGWFSRAEVGRFGWYICDTDIRGRLNINAFLDLKIPKPSVELIEAAANLYEAHQMRASINDRLKAQLKDICPILIRGSIEEASR